MLWFDLSCQYVIYGTQGEVVCPFTYQCHTDSYIEGIDELYPFWKSCHGVLDRLAFAKLNADSGLWSALTNNG